MRISHIFRRKPATRWLECPLSQVPTCREGGGSRWQVETAPAAGTPAERNTGDSGPNLNPASPNDSERSNGNGGEGGACQSPVTRNLSSDLTSEDNLRACHILHFLIYLSVPGVTQQSLRKRHPFLRFTLKSKMWTPWTPQRVKLR